LAGDNPGDICRPCQRAIRNEQMNQSAHAKPAEVRERPILGTRIRELRLERGWTQETLASHAGLSPDLVRKIEQGRKNTPRITSLDALAAALGVSIAELMTESRAKNPAEQPRESHSSASLDSGEQPAETAGTFGVLLTKFMDERGVGVRELARQTNFDSAYISKVRIGSKKPSPRMAEVLDSTLSANGKLAEAEHRIAEEVAASRTPRPFRVYGSVSLAPHPDFYDRLTRVVEKRASVDPQVIAWMERCLAEHRRVEDSIGAEPLIEIIGSQLSVATGLARETTGRLSDSVVDLAAQYAQFMAWLCNDLGNKGAALAWYDRAQDWAIEAGDANMAATTLSMKAHLAWSAGDAVRCVRLGEAARWHDNRTSIGVQGMATQMIARGHALDSDADKAHRAIDEAESLVSSAASHPEDEPPWMYFYGETWLMAQRGMIETELAERKVGNPRHAVALLGKALKDLPESYRRDRAWYGTMLARAHAAANDYDAAVGTALKFASDAVAVNKYATRDLEDLSSALGRRKISGAQDLAGTLSEMRRPVAGCARAPSRTRDCT
jgi:transcriptional regulator with XRE-family HTH domain